MQEIIIILLALCLIGLIITIALLLSRKRLSSDNDFNESLNDVRKSLNDTIINFSRQINDSMAESRIKTTKDINEYRDSINEKLQNEFKVLNESVAKSMEEINHRVELRLNQGFEKNNKTFEDITNRMAVIDKAQENITKLSSDVVSLQNVLTNNQARGAFGEHQLNQILFSAYGENNRIYQTQYTMKELASGEKVRADAVIFMPEPHNIVCIDSKFPFSAYSRLFEKHSEEEEVSILREFKAEVKKHIEDISRKYIIPNKTAEYAVMFVASDGILAIIHTKCPELIELAQNKSVLIVSPTTIFPLLQTYKMVYIDHERNKNAKEISEQIKLLNKDFIKVGSEWDKINKGINSLHKNSEDFDKRVNRISDKFEKIKIADFDEDERVIENKEEE